MASDGPRLTLTIPSDIRLMGVVRAFVEAACQANEFDAPFVHAVVLATTEAASNVIRHAHRNLAVAELQLECYLGTDSVEVRLLDEGEPFDLSTVPELDPAEIRVGGRGVFLMRKLMDEVSCERRGPRGNTLRMVKNVRPDATRRECG
jgi:serine/threonine-protein kinase RsbW